MPIAEDGSVVGSNFYSKRPVTRAGYVQVRGQWVALSTFRPGGSNNPAPISRQVIRAARRNADQQTARLAEIPSVRMLRATVASVAPGGAGDGNAKVWVTWRGEVLEATYGAHYTPVVGHRVLCVIVDNQLEIVQRTVGATPTAT